jgi:hypothetical protein
VLALVVLLALLVRLALVVGTDRPLVSDERDYDALGWTLASTGRYAEGDRPTAYRPVGYPAFIASVYAIAGHSPRWVFVTQAFLDAATALLLFLALRRRHPRGALGAAIGWGFFPPAVVYSGLLYSETLFAFLLAAGACMAVAEPRRSHRFRFLLGTLFGILALVKPATLALVALLPLVMFDRVRRWRRAAVLAAGVLLVVVPWSWRNVRAVGTASIASSSAAVFLIGNHPNATGGYAPDVPAAMRPRSQDEAAAARESGRAAWAYIQAYPARFVVGIARRWAHMFMGEAELAVTAFHPSPGDRTTSYRQKVAQLPPFLVLSLWVPYALALLVGVWGLLSRPRDPLTGLFLALVAAWLLAHGVTFGGSRYHAPWLPLLIAFAAEYLAAPAAAPRLGVRRRLLWFGIAAACAGLWFLEGAHYL